MTSEDRQRQGNEKVARFRQVGDPYEAIRATACVGQIKRQRQAPLANLDPSRIDKCHTRKDWFRNLIV